MGKHTAEYALLLIVVLVVAYLVVTPIANNTAAKMNEAATLITDATKG